MTTTLDPILTICGTTHIWIVRSGPEHKRYGDPYTISCVLVRINDTTAHIQALVNSSNKSAARALFGMRETLRQAGFTQVLWERRKNVQVQL